VPAQRNPRAPLFVSDAEIHWLVARFHVSTPDAEIADDINRRLDRVHRTKNVTDTLRADVVERAIAAHHANQALYSAVQRGNLS
jgi:hypothetical protein